MAFLRFELRGYAKKLVNAIRFERQIRTPASDLPAGIKGVKRQVSALSVFDAE
ncbi:MAG TPA: hypothetical protein VKB26_05295 [Candidatus Acidoferrales bacterium]|nr:hypothetical protein [Candidatus Acidoferrales bacterium]